MPKRGAVKGIKKGELSPKQKRVAQLYLDRNNPETFSNKTKSYLAAGYKGITEKSASAAATRMFQQESMQKYLQQIDATEVKEVRIIQEITAEKARNDLLEYLEACKSKGDLTNWGAAIRLQLQVTGQLSEKVVHTIEDSRKLNESHRRQAQRIASIINRERMLCQSEDAVDGLNQACLPPIDAQFVEQEDCDESDNE